ncbi:hypothetical protein [Candidatus Amarobacter glycogenicus]
MSIGFDAQPIQLRGHNYDARFEAQNGIVVLFSHSEAWQRAL